ncbi:hypothetical protein V6Z63_13795 [Leptospira borgpetersenii]
MDFPARIIKNLSSSNRSDAALSLTKTQALLAILNDGRKPRMRRFFVETPTYFFIGNFWFSENANAPAIAATRSRERARSCAFLLGFIRRNLPGPETQSLFVEKFRRLPSRFRAGGAIIKRKYFMISKHKKHTLKYDCADQKIREVF